MNGKYTRVHLKTGETLEGVMAARSWKRSHYLLQAPKLLHANEQSTNLDGEVAIPQNNVLFVQVIQLTQQ